MASWELYAQVPDSLLEVKVAMIPKPSKVVNNECGPGSLRPINIESIWFRAWSKTWLIFWCKQKIPPTHAGSLGPEDMAVIINAFLRVYGHGCALDYGHAFDTLMELLMLAVLPPCLRQMISTLFAQWKVERSTSVA